MPSKDLREDLEGRENLKYLEDLRWANISLEPPLKTDGWSMRRVGIGRIAVERYGGDFGGFG